MKVVLFVYLLNGTAHERLAFDTHSACVQAAQIMNERVLPALKETYALSKTPNAGNIKGYGCEEQFGGK